MVKRGRKPSSPAGYMHGKKTPMEALRGPIKTKGPKGKKVLSIKLKPPKL